MRPNVASNLFIGSLGGNMRKSKNIDQREYQDEKGAWYRLAKAH
jgi:hypothetical protein